MNFKSDLIDIIKHYFSMEGISSEGDGEGRGLAARFCEMRIRRIVQKPRTVHFSNELHDSLGKLTRETNAQRKGRALEVWRAVFHMRHLLENGAGITPYLSRRVNDSTSTDKLLWDYGMHHFHLNSKSDASGFIERSDYLLFAIVADKDAYFVDVRRHQDPEKLLWVRQDLLRIVHSNWPEVTNSHSFQDISGDTVTDAQKGELRRKNINLIAEVGGPAVAPLGMGIMADGSSTFCSVWGDKLLFEVERHESYFYSQPPELRRELEAKGVDVSSEMEFQLVLLDSLNPSAEVIESLQGDYCLSRELCRLGFAIVEATTKLPISVSVKDDP